MKHNKEQIMTALECCGETHNCNGCPYRYSGSAFEHNCVNDLLLDALALFKSEYEDRPSTAKNIGWVMDTIKSRASKVSYADMAVSGVTHEIFSIKGADLDEIEKEFVERLREEK